MFDDPREPNPTEPRYAPNARDTHDTHDPADVLPTDLGSMHDRLTDLAGHWATTLPSGDGLSAYARLLTRTDAHVATAPWEDADDDDALQITALPPASDDMRRVPLPGAHTRGWPVGAVFSAVLVVVLLAGILTRFGPAHPARQGDPPIPSPVPETIVNRSATTHGYTIHVERAFADATRTVISYSMTPDGSIPALPEPVTPKVVVSDAQGDQYAEIFGQWEPGLMLSGFAPLPPERLGKPQTLTLRVQQLEGSARSSSTAGDPVRDGPWQISFPLTPAAGPSVALHIPAITNGGLTIQPLRLDVSPGLVTGLDDIHGGARVVLRLSGLSPQTEFSALIPFPTGFRLPANGPSSVIPGLPGPAVQYPTPAPTPSAGTSLVLHLPAGGMLTPGFALPLGLHSPANTAGQDSPGPRTVGPSGSADITLLFYFAPLHLTSTAAARLTFTLQPASTFDPNSLLQLSPGGGVWTFPLPLA